MKPYLHNNTATDSKHFGQSSQRQAGCGRLGVTGLASLIAAVSLTALTACGGGGGGSTSVTTLSASGLRFGGNMVVTVNGSGLDAPGLQMQVAGGCTDVARSTVSSDSQTAFSCRLTGVGQMEPVISTATGSLLASLKVRVPTPQVSMTLTQGDRVGTMLIELDPNAASETVKNFLDYMSLDFYRNTIFHRVVNGKLAQAGGYSTGPTPKPAILAPIALQSDRGLNNLRGTIAMARTADFNSATSQFYFNVSDNPEFDFMGPDLPGYAVFGRIISGLNVLDELGRVPTQIVDNEFPALPLQEVVITSLVQLR